VYSVGGPFIYDGEREMRYRIVRTLGLAFAAIYAFAVPHASAQQAATVTATLSINDNGSGVYDPGHFALYASDSTADGNGGIMGFAFDVNYNPSTSAPDGSSPLLTYQTGGSTTYELGFTFARVQSELDGQVGGFQDVLDGVGTCVPIYGFGQMEGDLDSLVPSGATIEQSVNPSYGAMLLLQTGTFSNVVPFFDQNESLGEVEALVFENNLGIATEVANINYVTQTLVPEPAGLGIVGVAASLLLRRR
jgi:hypothetical protein